MGFVNFLSANTDDDGDDVASCGLLTEADVQDPGVRSAAVAGKLA